MEEVRDALSAWERHADRYGVPGGVVAQIRKELEARDHIVRSSRPRWGTLTASGHWIPRLH